MFATNPEHTFNTTTNPGCIFNTSTGPGSITNKTIAQALIATAALLNSSVMPPMATPMTTMTSTTTTNTSPPSFDHFLDDQPNCLQFEVREVIPCSGPKKNLTYRPFAPDGSTINSNPITARSGSSTVPNPTEKLLKTDRQETDGSASDSKAADGLGGLGSPTDNPSTVQNPTDESVETDRRKTVDLSDSKATKNGPLAAPNPTHEPIETNQNEPTTADGHSLTVSAQKTVPTSPDTATADGYAPEISAVATARIAVSSDAGGLQSSPAAYPPRDDQSTGSAWPEIDGNPGEFTSEMSLHISAVVVEETGDSELYSGSTDDYGYSTGGATESTSSPPDDPFSSSVPADSFTASMPSTTAADTEPTAGDDGGEVSVPSATDQRPEENDGYREDTTDEIPTTGPSRVKRTLQMVLNETHCYRIVCSPRPTVSDDVTKSSSSPIATGPPGEYYTLNLQRYINDTRSYFFPVYLYRLFGDDGTRRRAQRRLFAYRHLFVIIDQTTIAKVVLGNNVRTRTGETHGHGLGE